MLKKYLFTDLDDTQFQSRRKCPEDTALQPIAYLKDGSAHSFATPTQNALWALCQREMNVIPVTARNADAFSRVRLPFTDHAIINYGGVILTPDGQPDPVWLKKTVGLAMGTLPVLQAILQFVQQRTAANKIEVRTRIIKEFDVPFYLSTKSDEEHPEALDWLEPELQQFCAGMPFNVHRNGNNLSVLPAWLDKRYAVRYLIGQLRREHGDIITIGMGDSLSDFAFMNLCDYALVPQVSQIADTLREI